jgi:hypothetical protein
MVQHDREAVRASVTVVLLDPWYIKCMGSTRDD